MAETFETKRFGGPIGRLVAETQESLVASFLAPLDGQRVLDVGTGTGRAAISLAQRGAQVTAVDASAEMLAVARARAREREASVMFVRGDAHHLEFDDRSFDTVVCLRVLMHTQDWRRSLGELCRVARQRVVLDYPALCSVAAVQAAARRLGHRLGARVEAYRVFADATVARALEANGFRVVGSHRQFVLPIAFHKALGSLTATMRIESGLAAVGLRALFGSPVTILAERIGTGQD